MLIYITVNIRGSVFSGSEAQTALQLAYALSETTVGSIIESKEPIIVKLLNINSQPWYDDCFTLKNKFPIIQIDLSETVIQTPKADILIDVTGLPQ